MAQPKINTRARSFAAGLALRSKNGELKFTKVFWHTEENDEPVRDFFRILAEASLYSGGNEIIEISKKQAKDLLSDFAEHTGTLEFLNTIGKQGGAVVVMHYKRIPTNYEEASMLAALLKPPTKKPEKKKKKKK